MLALILGSAAAILPSTGAPAQETNLSLTLVSQTPWATPSQPFMHLEVAMAERNGQSLDGLWLRVAFLEPLLSRSELRLAMTQDTGAELSATTFPLTPVDAGETVTQGERLRVAFLEQAATEARVYPVRVEVLQGRQGPSLATLRTTLVFLPRRPAEPLDLAWTFVLGNPIEFGPDGVFLGRALERRLEPGGSLSGLTGTLASMLTSPEQVPVDVVVSPTLLANLRRMQDGYDVATGRGMVTVSAEDQPAQDAARVLSDIRTIVASGSAEVSAMPYGVPDLPELVASGLGSDIPLQLNVGRAAVASTLAPASGGPEPEAPGWSGPEPGVLRPPGSALDEVTLQILRRQDVSTLLLDEGVVQQPRQVNDFAPPMAAALGGGLVAVVPDEGIQGLLADPLAQEDPPLAAQYLVSDLASIWLEQPDTQRATALILSGEQNLDQDYFEPLIHDIRDAPWLRTAKASNLVERFPPDGDPARVRLRVGDRISSGYLAAIEQNGELIARYRSILVDPASTAMPATLARDILLTEGSSMVERERLGFAWLDSITTRVQDEFAKIGADTAQIVTLTSSGGRIPVRVSNDSEQRVKIRVELRSSRLRFAGGSTRDVSLDPAETRILIFEATAQTTGTFPVSVAVETPDGDVLSESRIVVRSTAYNLIALLITAGAMVVLLVVWGRRNLSRKKS